jgi:hypothetical protein
MQYRAHYTNHAADTRLSTRWYPTAEAAQDALMRRPEIGHFPYLGRVSGDAVEPGKSCVCAPRRGGLVDIQVRKTEPRS